MSFSFCPRFNNYESDCSSESSMHISLWLKKIASYLGWLSPFTTPFQLYLQEHTCMLNSFAVLLSLAHFSELNEMGKNVANLLSS